MSPSAGGRRAVSPARDGSASIELVVLLRRVREAEDRWAAPELSPLLERLYLYLKRRLARRLTDGVDAEAFAQDIAQEAVFCICERLDQCKATTDVQLQAWAYTIARRIAIRALRRSLARMALLSYSRDFDRVLDASAVREWRLLEAEEAGEDEGADTVGKIVLRLLVDARRRLPTGTVKVLTLHAVEEQSWAEVARELGTTSSAAKRRFQRATVHLRKAVLNAVRLLPARDRERVLARLLSD